MAKAAAWNDTDAEALKASKRETFLKMSLLLRAVRDYDVDRLQV